ncbi:GntR family transcriptional regulator [soil metagenome]
MVDKPFTVVRESAPLRKQVRELLRAEIVSMRFKPGQRLVERELCDLACVSRTVIREALRELETDGLVHIVPNKGPIVAPPIGADEARGLYETRAVLEGLAGRAFVQRATPDERAALHAAFDKFERGLDLGEKDPHVILEAKREFYDILLAGARNSTVTSILSGLKDRITALRALTVVHPGRAPQSLAELRAIVDAVDTNDPVAAWSACLLHVQSAAEVALQILESQHAAANAEVDEPAIARPARSTLAVPTAA